MPFQLSPGVVVVEKDFSTIVPAVSTSAGAFAGAFQWGPVLDPVTVSSENVLVQRFGKPNDAVAQSFFTAANFLSYTNNLLVVRVDGTNYKNAVATGTAVKIRNFDDYTDSYAAGEGSVGEWAAKYPGSLGNSLMVAMADSATFTGWSVTLANGSTLNLEDQFDGAPDTSSWASSVDGSNDELHIAIIDEDGLWTGTPGTVLEKFAYVSKASDAKKSDGTNNYYKDVVNSQSRYVWWMDHTTTVEVTGDAWGTAAAGKDFKDLTADVNKSLTGGVDDHAPADGDIQNGYAVFTNAELYDISLMPLGAVKPATAKWVVDNVVLNRKDCVAFISPVNKTTYEPILSTAADPIQDIIDFRQAAAFNVDSSYAVLDSGFKYQYDRYNDKYRWVPLNGDVAGLCARTDYTDDPWYSPGGLNRGQVKNVVKLGVNPDKTDRDNLYKNGINPVVSFPGQGTVLFGDKTLQSRPSAFDRINVRRLFIVLEKAIAVAAKYQLFEFNDSFTRAQFRNLVEPFLRDVQGRRGIVDFRVKCDETNNTGEVIDRNEFVADIFIKPNRSINFITLNFVAARSSVNFEEIGA